MTPPFNSITVGLIGNPNCGKTALFNKLSNSHDSVGNYPRVTVDLKEKSFIHKGREIRLVDLPGVYSLTSQSPEERISREFIQSRKADVLINVLDMGNLERSLFLTTQLLEMGHPTVYDLNMADEARRKGIRIALKEFSDMLAGPVVETVATAGQGLEALLDAVVERAAQGPQHPVILPYDSHLEEAVGKVKNLIRLLHPQEMDDFQSRWLAIKLLEGDDELLRSEEEHNHLMELVRRERYDLSWGHGEQCETMFAYARYGFIHGLLSEVRTQVADPLQRMEMTRKIDRVLLHNVLGLPMFLFLMWLMFESTFTLGAYPADWIDAGVRWTADVVGGLLPDGVVHDLIVDGLITGMGAVVVFLPYIVILFLFIALFSETGYLARTSFLLDRVMHLFGLHGKAFIPLVMGFGCNVPAVMATRTIESPRSRLIAILINPFMSCSQRLPAFILFSGAFFAEWAGRAVFAMYLLSIAVSMAAAVFLSRFVIHGGKESFVMELPPYRLPTLESILYHMWSKAYDFVRMVGGVIVVGSILVWFLQEFPKEIPFSVDHDAQIEQAAQQGAGPERDQAVARLKRLKEKERVEKSYLGRAGMTVAPFFEPLGFDWKDSVAIITGVFAKEVIVASYAVLYAQDDSAAGSGAEGAEGLRSALQGAMTPVTAFTLMVFLLLYSPCLSTIAAIRRETESWKWAGFSVVFSLTIAWTLAYLVAAVGNHLA